MVLFRPSCSSADYLPTFNTASFQGSRLWGSRSTNFLLLRNVADLGQCQACQSVSVTSSRTAFSAGDKWMELDELRRIQYSSGRPKGIVQRIHHPHSAAYILHTGFRTTISDFQYLYLTTNSAETSAKHLINAQRGLVIGPRTRTSLWSDAQQTLDWWSQMVSKRPRSSW